LLQSQGIGIVYETTWTTHHLIRNAKSKVYQDLYYVNISARYPFQDHFDGEDNASWLKIVFLAVVIAVVLGSSLYVSLVILPATEKQEALDKFKALRKGMSYEKMITIVGEPNQDIGSGIHVYLYKLPDGTEVIVGVGEGLMYVKQKISNDTYVDLIQ